MASPMPKPRRSSTTTSTRSARSRPSSIYSSYIPRRDSPGSISRGATESNQMLIFEELMDSNPLFLTGNTDTVYCFGFLDLEKDGPTVVEIPPGADPAPLMMPSSASSSTWALLVPIGARVASISSCLPAMRVKCPRTKRTEASTTSRNHDLCELGASSRVPRRRQARRRGENVQGRG